MLLSGGGSDDCARGGDTSSSRSLRPSPRGQHHSAHGDRGWPGPGGGCETCYTAKFWEEYFGLDDDSVPKLGGSRPDQLPGSGPQELVQRHTVEQIIDSFAPVPMLDAPVQAVGQLLEVLKIIDTLVPDVEQAIEVPKIVLHRVVQDSREAGGRTMALIGRTTVADGARSMQTKIGSSITMAEIAAVEEATHGVIWVWWLICAPLLFITTRLENFLQLPYLSARRTWFRKNNDDEQYMRESAAGGFLNRAERHLMLKVGPSKHGELTLQLIKTRFVGHDALRTVLHVQDVRHHGRYDKEDSYVTGEAQSKCGVTLKLTFHGEIWERQVGKC